MSSSPISNSSAPLPVTSAISLISVLKVKMTKRSSFTDSSIRRSKLMLTDNVIFSFLLRFCKPFWKILLHCILGKRTGSSNFWWSRKVRFPYDLIHACIRQRENLLICRSPQSMFFNDREVSQTLLENKITLLFKSCGLEASRIRVVVFEGVANPSVECTYTSKLLDKAIWLFKRICMLSKYPK